MITSKIEGSEKQQAACGIVMPMAAWDGCLDQHWAEVQAILEEAIREAGFDPRMVSTADDVGVIQGRVIQNLYEVPLVVCDVSGRNPNVMFELGIRLAFDKPTIIVKDEGTKYSFDTAPIEHLAYPRDLRMPKMRAFVAQLVQKLQGTYKKSQKPDYTTFLKHFGTFKVAKLEAESLPQNEYIVRSLEQLTERVGRLVPQPDFQPSKYKVAKAAMLYEKMRDAISDKVEVGAGGECMIPGKALDDVRREIEQLINNDGFYGKIAMEVDVEELLRHAFDQVRDLFKAGARPLRPKTIVLNDLINAKGRTGR